MTETILFLERIDTPTGPMRIVTDADDRLRVLDWDDGELRLRQLLQRHYGSVIWPLPAPTRPTAARRALEAYFAGELHAIDTLAVAAHGTPFQRAVWRELRRIPVGQTLSYGALAQRIGRPRAVRAVGLANGANPIAVVVPCHRVIGADRTLTGYGGGLQRKRWLLAHEGAAHA
jgi:methylated-DNA-[protein]-cysteine S-methyltransferase